MFLHYCHDGRGKGFGRLESGGGRATICRTYPPRERLAPNPPMRRGEGAAAGVRAATKGAVIGDNNKCNKYNGDKDVDVIYVVVQSPKKRQRIRSLFLILEARREAKNSRQRERRAALKRRANKNKAALAAVSVSKLLTASMATTTEMSAATTVSPSSFKYPLMKNMRRRGNMDGPEEEEDATTMTSKLSNSSSTSLLST